MTNISTQDPLHVIRATLQSIDSRLQRGDLPPDGLADLKSAIDDVRLRVWAAQSATGAADAESILLRFRLRRATEICADVLRDLEAETLGRNQRELMELRATAQQLTERITLVVRGET